MKKYTLKQSIIIAVLAFLTALEPLSIDLYLPGFVDIAKTFKTTTGAVQISLSTFLAGFAIGQLFWGPLADRYGRKKPILASLVLFIVASLACIWVSSIEQLWVMRFIQALGGCAGVVIGRAVVTDYFHKSQTLSIFGLLALIMGVAPIIAPVIGNVVLGVLGWKGLFEAMAVLGVIGFALTFFWLPETKSANQASVETGILKTYWSILKNRKFLIYSMIIGIANGALMIYVANGPFIIMEKGGFSTGEFSIIFSINAVGFMTSSYLPSLLNKVISKNTLISLSIIMLVVISSLFILAVMNEVDMAIILVLLFFYVFPLGLIFPITTDLAMNLFSEEISGSASSLFGSIQLSLAFVFSVIAGFLSDGTLLMVGLILFFCAISALIVIFLKRFFVIQKEDRAIKAS